MHTLIAYAESKDTAAVLVAIAGVVDQHVVVNGDDIIVPEVLDKVAMAYGIGDTITLGQLSSPTLRKQMLVDLPITEPNANPQEDPRYMDIRMAPRQLKASEALNFLVAEAAGGAELEFGFVWLTDGDHAPVEGEVNWVRCTGTATLVANVWTLVPLVFTQQLEAGTYAVVGMRAWSATGMVARIVFPGYQWRPGCIMHTGPLQEQLDPFQPDGFGKWGEFVHTYPPQVEMIATAGDTAEEVYLALVKVA